MTLLSNGKDTWMIGCRWCDRRLVCPAGKDDLRALAVAKAAGWQISQYPAEEWRTICPECSRRGCR